MIPNSPRNLPAEDLSKVTCDNILRLLGPER
jgi:hypothetical protein